VSSPPPHWWGLDLNSNVSRAIMHLAKQRKQFYIINPCNSSLYTLIGKYVSDLTLKSWQRFFFIIV